MSSEEKHQILEAVKQEIQADEGRDNEARLSYFVIGIFIGVLLVIVLSMAWQKSKENKITALDQSITDLNTNLKGLEGSENQSLGLLQQLDIFTLSLSGKVKLSDALNNLRSYQYKRSRWTSLNFTKDSFVLTAQADNFDDVAKSVAIFKNLKQAKDVKLTSANLNPESKKVDFEITILMDMSQYRFKAINSQAKNI